MQTGGLQHIATRIRTTLLTLVLLGSSFLLHAQTEKYIQSLTGKMKAGDSCVVVDDKFTDTEKWATIEKHRSVNNLVTFELRYDTAANFFTKKFTCKLQVDIEYQKSDRTKQQLRNITLEVNFDTTRGSKHQGIAYYKFKDAHYVTVKINKITSKEWGNKIPQVFRVKNEIFVERSYTVNTKIAATTVTGFNPNQKTTSAPVNMRSASMGFSLNSADVPGELYEANWDVMDPALQGFSQYDFEWTFYDYKSVVGDKVTNSTFVFSDNNLSELFRNNCSRVTIGASAYQLNLVYNKGYVFHRVRGVSFDETTGERTEGTWSYAGNFSGWGVVEVLGHEAFLNWQYNHSFAEEGKRKEVVSYFDGSLRNRQSVTLNNDNTGSATIVQENVFDALGRAAVNILPAPTEENTIHYFHEFNKSNVTSQPYRFSDIETPGQCVIAPAAMSTASGASQYYSPDNPRKADNSPDFYFTRYIPDAQGFPFTVTHFTPDNTGRIRSQGGVGAIYQPGKSTPADDHTTQYFYGKPQQDELDRLFGNEAGNASHYLKNMVVDANGQVSVSYINAGGKTIATALGGKSPDNLQTLPSYQLKSTPFITSLVDRDNVVRDAANLSISYNGTFLASATGNFTLQYEFTPLSLQVLYGLQNDKICADCYYDLYINVTDDCGNSIQTVTEPAVFTEKATCDPAPTTKTGTLPVTIVKPGEYNISYKLALSRKAIDFYVDQYLVQNLSLKQEIDFKRNYIHQVDLSGCYNNCETCVVDLGTEQDFVTRMTGVLLQQNITANTDDVDWMKATYKQLLDECTLLQEGCGKTDPPCEEQTQQIRDDVSPGGQYMLYDANTNAFTDRDINVFLKNKASLTQSVTINGVTQQFGQFSDADIILNWKDEWVDMLMPFHPENIDNCFINDCGKNAESEAYDKSFLNTTDAPVARAKHYWFDDDYTSVVNNDPYFKTGAEGASLKATFLDKLGNYHNTGVDIMAFVRWSVYCKKAGENEPKPADITPCPRNSSCNLQEDEWALFKNLYYSAKQEIKKQGGACTSNADFGDVAALLAPALGAPAPQTSCASASLFDISRNNTTITIKYIGAQATTKAITIQYLGINASGNLETSATGSVSFPSGTVTDAVQTATGLSTLTYIINYARCDLAHPYYTKTRRNYNGIDLSTINSQITGQGQGGLNATATTAMIANCNESCTINADGWMQKLAGCNLAISSTEYTQIHDGLIAVCQSSCQVNVADHPFGASSTTTPTINGDKNFKDVLLRVLGATRFSAVCNDLLLDYPAPVEAGKPLYTNEVVRTLEPCAYDKLKTWKTAYQSSTGYTSIADYIQKNIDPAFSLTDNEINSLLGAYENNCVTPKPIALPASLSCNTVQPKTCLTCTEIQDEKINFEAAYTYVASTDPDYYELLAKYINRKYGFNLSSVDVYQALQDCAANGGGNGGGGNPVNCTDFTTAYNHFQQLQPGYFTYPDHNPNADSLYKIHLTLWLNTELNRSLSFEYYSALATTCNITIAYPQPDTCGMGFSDCAPQFVTCCEPFAELERFKQVFAGSVNARLMALYFTLLHTQWCTPVNLPNIDYNQSYASLLDYFAAYKLANAYNIIVRPDSLISYTIENTGSCTATALNFVADPYPSTGKWYAVCNKPAQPTLAIDTNSCINQQINLAIGNAHSDYLEYIDEVKRDYRDAYYTKCLSITPLLKLEATYNQPLEYHYTLYYYDQAGNLVKTVPPAGVQPVDDGTNGAANMDRVRNFRLADKDYCYEYGDAPAFNGSASITVADNAAIKQNALPFTVEAFVNFSSLSSTQTILSKQSVNSDGKTDGYRVYLDNDRLKVDLGAHGTELWTQTLVKTTQYNFPSYYTPPIPPVTIRTKSFVDVPRSLYRSVTAQITSNISGIISSGQWVYIAVQQTGDWKNPVRIYINGNLVNSELLTNGYDYTPATSPVLSPADIAAGTTEFSFAYTSTVSPLTVNNPVDANLIIGSSSAGLSGSIKQVRVYNRALPASEIRNNAFNTCLVPQSEGKLVIWLPLNKEETAGVSIDRINQYNTANVNTVFSNLFQPVYPVHKLPTHYYYNTLNAVTKQVSPDGGESNFWYDLLGRLVVSQNAEQLTSSTIRGESNNRYSYTKYDVLGRITEVGEKTGAASMTTAIAKTDPTIAGSNINTWLASGTNIQVTQTIYDQPDVSVVTNTAITNNQNIYNTSRKRVVASIYRETITSATDYNTATHYQYDINGNVKRLWQEHKKSVTGAPINLLKEFKYDYDLVSGKVNSLIYQEGKGDQFVYKYDYDPDNRLLSAFSGRDMNTLQKDAGYRYYLHGPLARMELGAESRLVQGSDYAYTLQGWLKGVNGTLLAPAGGTGGGGLDMGNDGSNITAAGLGSQVGADALSYTLGYFQNDYVPIGGGTLAPGFGIQYQNPSITGSDVTGKSLFNGNISSTLYAIGQIDNGAARGYSYGYDQLNRLREMRAHSPLPTTVSGASWSNSSILTDHKETYIYDANGNIVSLFRNGTTAGGRSLAMDNLQYSYYYYTNANVQKTYNPSQPFPSDAWNPTNQLAHVKDAVGASAYPISAFPDEKDIDDQSDNNYTYDGIGNLVADNAEGISKIGWTVYGKIRSIDKTDGTAILYDYDAAGNRIQKQVSVPAIGAQPASKTITYYICDAQGSTIGVYSWKGAASATPVASSTVGLGVTTETWDEQHLYGSSRLGMWKPAIAVPATLNTTTDAVLVGSKLYELTNHLGNVLATISDNKIAVDANTDGTTDYYAPEVISANDYTPFGMQMVGRAFNIGGYRYGFNGKESDNEVKGEGNQQDYGMRIYDPRIGKFLSSDPLTTKFPQLTPYQFASNTPIQAIDLDGLESVNANTGQTDNTLNPQTVSKYQHNSDAKPWQDLIGFKVDKKVVQQMKDRFILNPSILHIETAVGGELNLDYYSTTITKLPNNMNASQLQEHIRKNFSSFINDDHMIFNGLDKEESKIWSSNSPISAVMSFKQDIFFNLYTEGASVLSSKVSPNFWTFSTLFTMLREGSHPVSGTRQFGLAESNISGATTYTFFTRGADRTTAVADAAFSSMMWTGADKVWNRLVTNVANFVNANGGQALINDKISKRISWKNDYLPTLNK